MKPLFIMYPINVMINVVLINFVVFHSCKSIANISRADYLIA